MKTYKIHNVNCQNCVNLIKNSLEDEFGKLEINVADKTITIGFDEAVGDGFENTLERFKNELSDLGFELEIC